MIKRESSITYPTIYFLILPSILALNSYLRDFGIFNIGIALYLLFNIYFLRSFNIKIPRSIMHLGCYFFLLVLLSFLSSFINNWIQPILVYGGFAIVTFITLFVYSGVMDPNKIINKIINQFMFCIIGVIIVGVIVEPVTMHRYEGIFMNPNSMGWFTGMSASFLFGALVSQFGIKSSKRIFLILLLLLVIIFMLASNSRNAVLGVCVSIASYLAMVFLMAICKLKLSISQVLKMLKVILAAGFLLVLLYPLGVIDPLITKYSVKLAAGDPFDGRMGGWMIMLNNITLWGLGDNYAEKLELTTKGHNSYLSQIMRYGLLTTIGYVLILAHIFIKCVSNYQNNSFAVITLCTLSCFISMSMFETGSATPGLWLTVIGFGLFLANERKKRWIRVASATEGLIPINS